MPEIIIHRNREYTNKLRRYGLYVDFMKVAEIKDGEILQLPVAAGKHTIEAKIDWTGSRIIEFELKDGETATFFVKGQNPFLALFYALFDPRNYLELIRVS